MMHDHIIRALLSSGTSAIGTFARCWIAVLACSVAALTYYIMLDGHGLVLSLVVAAVMTATMVALPAAAVVAVILAAVKF